MKSTSKHGIDLLIETEDTRQEIQELAKILKSNEFPDAVLYARGILAVKDDANKLPILTMKSILDAAKGTAIAYPDCTISIIKKIQDTVLEEVKKIGKS